jgi:hypothetical protein
MMGNYHVRFGGGPMEKYPSGTKARSMQSESLIADDTSGFWQYRIFKEMEHYSLTIWRQGNNRYVLEVMYHEPVQEDDVAESIELWRIDRGDFSTFDEARQQGMKTIQEHIA